MSYIEDHLPQLWQTTEDGDDTLLVCPCGFTIEQDGTCPAGCVSPLREQGLI